MSSAVAAPLRLEQANGVLEAALCAPPVNALSMELVAALEALADAGRGDGVRAVALVSEVPRVFMAGADAAVLASGDHVAMVGYVRRLQAAFAAIERLHVPVVAGIDGACLGGGLELALCCDIRIVSAGARLGLPEVGLGILPGAGGTQRLVRAVGQGVARDLLLTGRRIGGEEAVRWGLASRLAEPDCARTAARELARTLAAGASEAQAAIKTLALEAQDVPLADGLRDEVERWAYLAGTADAREGIAALRDKRTPRFR